MMVAGCAAKSRTQRHRLRELHRELHHEPVSNLMVSEVRTLSTSLPAEDRPWVCKLGVAPPLSLRLSEAAMVPTQSVEALEGVHIFVVQVVATDWERHRSMEDLQLLGSASVSGLLEAKVALALTLPGSW